MNNGITYQIYLKNGHLIEGKFSDDIELYLGQQKFITGKDIVGRDMSVNTDDISRMKKKYA